MYLPRPHRSPLPPQPLKPLQPHRRVTRQADPDLHRAAGRLDESPEGRDVEIGLFLHLLDGGLLLAQGGGDLGLGLADATVAHLAAGVLELR